MEKMSEIWREINGVDGECWLLRREGGVEPREEEICGTEIVFLSPVYVNIAQERGERWKECKTGGRKIERDGVMECGREEMERSIADKKRWRKEGGELGRIERRTGCQEWENGVGRLGKREMERGRIERERNRAFEKGVVEWENRVGRLGKGEMEERQERSVRKGSGRAEEKKGKRKTAPEENMAKKPERLA